MPFRVLLLSTARLARALPIAALLWSPALLAQTDPPPPPVVEGPTVPGLTPESVQARLDEFTANAALDPAVRDQAAALYKSALSRLEAARASDASAAAFAQAIESAPRELAEVRAGLAALATPDPQGAGPPLDSLSLAELDQRLTVLQVDSAAFRKAVADAESRLAAMLSRPTAARQEALDEKKQIEEIDRGLATPAPVGEAPEASLARQTSLKARRLASASRTDEIERELLSLPARQELVAAKRELATAQLARNEKLIEQVQAIAAARRQQEARDQQTQAERTKREFARRHPVLAAYAEGNASLSEQWTVLNAKLSKAANAQATTKALSDQLRDNAQAAKQLLEIGAVGEEYGLVLRELRNKLPDTARVMSEVAARDREIIDARLRRLQLLDQQRELLDIDAAMDRLLAAAPAEGPGSAPLTDDMRQTLRELMVTRKEILARRIEGNNQFVTLLSAVNADSRELAADNAALRELISERLLWLPSTSALGPAWARDLVAGLARLTDPGAWAHLGLRLWTRVASLPVVTALAVVAFALLIGVRRRLRRRLTTIAGRLSRVSTDSFLLTVETLAINLLLTLPWPVLLGTTGGLLMSDAAGQTFSISIGTGLVSAAIVVFILRTFHTMARDDGLFNAHFGWSERVCRSLGRDLLWLMALEATVAFLVSAGGAGGDEVLRNGLGRLAFIVGSIGLAVFTFRVLNPRTGAISSLVTDRPLLWKSRAVWFSLAVAAPGMLAILAALGYYETAAQVQQRIFTSGWVSLVGLIGYSLAIRWLLIAQRRLAMRQARERREKAQAARAKEATESTGEAAPQPLEEPQIDISAVSDQTRALLRFATGMSVFVALLAIWAALFPALQVLNQVTLWTHSVSGPDGETVLPVTLRTVVIALLIGLVTFVAARNLPGLAEIAILQRLSITAGTRYTIATLTRYTIFTVGLLLAINQLGADWSKMQWIVAALGVGLGFGLQEIVANFVSGLIILFEQPVRVGDLVTVGDRIGMVSRIKIRATTIIDPDNREVIIPNKAFITERVTNWALNDPTTRLVINVGIAYGSDTVLAHRVLLDTVTANPLVLKVPPPAILFMGFGDSALNFEVRVYVREIINRIPLTHDLHMAIHAALRDHDIEIPFPQRDLHIRSTPAPAAIPAAHAPQQPGQPADPAGIMPK